MNKSLKQKLNELKQARPSEQQKKDFRSILLSHMHAHPFERPHRLPFAFAFRLAPVAGLTAFFVLLSAGGVTYAAQGALPGELLYPIKRVAEEARIAIALNQVSKTELRLEFASRRLDEVEELIDTTDGESEHADIALEAYVEALAQSEVAVKDNQDDAAHIAVIIDKASEAQQKTIEKLSEKLTEKKRGKRLQERLEIAREDAEEKEDNALLIIVTATSSDAQISLPDPVVKKSREKIEKKERSIRKALRKLEEEKSEDSKEQQKETAEKLKEAEEKIERAKERLDEGEFRASIEQSIEAHRITKELRIEADERRKEREERDSELDATIDLDVDVGVEVDVD